MSDLLLVLVAMNLAAAVAVLVVLALRLPARRLFGAGVAYGLWAIVPLTASAVLWPSRVVRIAAPTPTVEVLPVEAAAGPAAAAGGPGLLPLLAVLWALGAVAGLAWLGRRQAQFDRAVRAGRAGPAVVGVLKPRVVTPADFADRYDERERQVVLAHETAHIRRHDSRVNAALAMLRCLNWFNPLIHLAAHYVRIDQELACDAQVVSAHPTARRVYAGAMLKTQLAARPLPLGCYWPAEAAHPLAQRIALLGRGMPRPGQRRIGALAIAALACATAGAAWACKPSRILFVPATPPSAVAAPAPEAPVRPAARRALRPAPAALAPRPEPIGRTAAADAAATEPAALPPAPLPVPAAVPDPAPIPAPPASAEDPRRIRANARPSSVEPGQAIRLIASTVDPEGHRLTNDITAYGSQSRFRTGSYSKGGSRQSLFTSVYQHGEKVWVTASLGAAFKAAETGGVALRSGETGRIVLPSGQVVTVTPLVRPETPDEAARGEGVRAAFESFARFRAEGRAGVRGRTAPGEADPPF